MSNKYLHCTYCEDIRHENSGQITLVGVFQGGVRVGAVPSVIPKLSVKVDLFISSEQESPKDASVQIRFGDDVVQDIPVPADLLARAKAESLADVSPAVGGYGIQLLLSFSPFEVKREDRLSVRAMLDGEVLKGNSLKVDVGPTAPPDLTAS